jgi:hypothetical protein
MTRSDLAKIEAAPDGNGGGSRVDIADVIARATAATASLGWTPPDPRWSSKCRQDCRR